MEEFPKWRRMLLKIAMPLSNALACLWAGMAAYILWQSYFFTHNIRLGVAALAAVTAAWATLERKRWGRIALIGLSLTTMLAFAFLLSAFAAFSDHVEPAVQSLGSQLRSLASLYDINMPAAIGLLALAVVTIFGMLNPHVISEFNRNKKPALLWGQHLIAIGLVCFWAAAITQMSPMMTERQGRTRGTLPLLAEQQSGARSGPLRAMPRRQNSPRYNGQAHNSLPVLSAASPKSR